MIACIGERLNAGHRILRLAVPSAHAHDVADVLIDGVFDGVADVEAHRAARVHVDELGAGGDAAGDLEIELRLTHVGAVRITHHAAAGDEDVHRVVGDEASRLAKHGDVAVRVRRLADDDDRHALPVDPACVHRVDVVDRREIRGRGVVLTRQRVERCRREVVDATERRHHVRERSRDGRLARQREVLPAAEQHTTHGGAERGLDLGHGAREVDRPAAARRAHVAEALRLQPCRDAREVRARRPEGGAELLGREPSMVIGRRRLLLSSEEIRERGRLLGRAAEVDGEPAEARVRSHGTAITGRRRERVHAASEGTPRCDLHAR